MTSAATSLPTLHKSSNLPPLLSIDRPFTFREYILVTLFPFSSNVSPQGVFSRQFAKDKDDCRVDGPMLLCDKILLHCACAIVSRCAGEMLGDGSDISGGWNCGVSVVGSDTVCVSPSAVSATEPEDCIRLAIAASSPKR